MPINPPIKVEISEEPEIVVKKRNTVAKSIDFSHIKTKVDCFRHKKDLERLMIKEKDAFVDDD